MLKRLANAREASAGSPAGPEHSEASAADKSLPALEVAMVYEDAVTRQWANDLWDRVRQLVDRDGIRCRSWQLGDLTQTALLAEAIQGASDADVLVIAIRDSAQVPVCLQKWINAWTPKRADRAGAMLALIGAPVGLNGQSGCAHKYLEAAARRAGLDFLPRDFKLPEEPPVASPQTASKPPKGLLQAVGLPRPCDTKATYHGVRMVYKATR